MKNEEEKKEAEAKAKLEEEKLKLEAEKKTKLEMEEKLRLAESVESNSAMEVDKVPDSSEGASVVSTEVEVPPAGTVNASTAALIAGAPVAPSTITEVAGDRALAPAVEIAVTSEGVTVPVDGIAAPTEGIAAPTEGISVTAEGVAVPAEGVTVPAERVAVPAERVAVPAEGVAVPAEGVAVPAEGVDVPTEGVAVPTEGVAVPAKGVEAGVTTPENVASPAEPEKKKKKKKKKKKPVVEIIPAVRIKEEPRDDDDILVQVKQEKNDEPEIQETDPTDEGIEVMDPSIAGDDDASMLLDTTGELHGAATQSNLLVSSIDGNVEQTDAPVTNPSTGPRIRLSGALGGLLAKAAANRAAAEASPISVIGVSSAPVVLDLDEDSMHGPTNKDGTPENNGDDNSGSDNTTTDENLKNKENGLPDEGKL